MNQDKLKLKAFVNSWLIEVAFSPYDREDMPKLAATLLKEIKDLFIELIGEDEFIGSANDAPVDTHMKDGRNQLRDELRAKAREL